jgi:hypothetical protein
MINFVTNHSSFTAADSGFSIRVVLHQDMMQNVGLNSMRLPFSAPQMNPELQGLQRTACKAGIAENSFL